MEADPLGSRGAVFYDDACGHCRRLARLVRRPLSRRGIGVVPLQTPNAAQMLDVAPERLLDELRMIAPDGGRLAGADAVVAVCREVPWLRPLALTAGAPGAMPLLRYGYRRVARARGCALPDGAAPNTADTVD